MSIWLSKKVIEAVAEPLLRVASGPIAIASTPRLRKALVAGFSGIEPWHRDHSELAALVVEGTGRIDEGTARRWAASLRRGGLLICVDKGRASEASRRLLCAGFCDIGQVQVARRIVTSASASHILTRAPSP